MLERERTKNFIFAPPANLVITIELGKRKKIYTRNDRLN